MLLNLVKAFKKMKKRILITGANGMVAKHLANLLAPSHEVRFLTRKVRSENEFLWDLSKNYIDPKALQGINVIIHLAGASIADGRWTEKRKQQILSSRVESAKLILAKLIEHQIVLDAFVSASGTGYYGAETSDKVYDEQSSKGNDFLSDVCEGWENVAYTFKNSAKAKKVAVIRTGIVLAKEEGALNKIAQPIKFGFGAPIGSGKQYVPWIHIDDLCEIYKFVVENENIEGTYNAVAPMHIDNEQMTKTIANVVKRPLILPNIPNFVMKLLFGEMSIILLEGSKVSSDKIQKDGFNFKYHTFIEAARNLL